MRDVAVLGLGMHPWGKFADKSVTDLCRVAVEAALADAGLAWRDIQAVSAASSRFSGGKGWGLNGNDVVEEMGSTGIPVYNLSAGCAAGGNAFNIGYSLVAGGFHDIVLVVGGEKMPKGFIQTSGIEDETDPEFLRQRCIGMPGPCLLGAAHPSPHEGLRHDGGAAREGRRQSPRDRQAQRVRALPAGVHPREGDEVRTSSATPCDSTKSAR